MTKEEDLQAVIDLIYEAVLDETLWPIALTRLPMPWGRRRLACLAWTVVPYI